MASPQDVVITGSGMVSPIGIGNDAVWSQLQAKQSGVRQLEWLVGTDFPVRFGGEVADFEPKKYVKPRKALKVMSREIQMGFAAAELARADAALDVEQLEPDRLGVVYGGDMYYCPLEELEDTYRACMASGEFDFAGWGEAAMKQLYPLWMLKYLPNMPACHVGIALDARGHNNTITVGEASGLLAVIEAASVIQRGLTDVMIAGGSGSRINITPVMYRGDLNLSQRNDDPAAACRPFDAGRDGTVNGEGAGAIILESRDHAERRGATIRAQLTGWASGFFRRRGALDCDSAAIARNIERCLSVAQWAPEAVGHVNANGTGIMVPDQLEAQAIRSTLGNVPVTAPKSFFGNLGTSTGIAEFIVSVLALQRGEVPVTLNFEQPDPECPVNVIAGEACTGRPRTALALNQSGTGQVVSVALAAETHH